MGVSGGGGGVSDGRRGRPLASTRYASRQRHVHVLYIGTGMTAPTVSQNSLDKHACMHTQTHTHTLSPFWSFFRFSPLGLGAGREQRASTPYKPRRLPRISIRVPEPERSSCRLLQASKANSGSVAVAVAVVRVAPPPSEAPCSDIPHGGPFSFRQGWRRPLPRARGADSRCGRNTRDTCLSRRRFQRWGPLGVPRCAEDAAPCPFVTVLPKPLWHAPPPAPPRHLCPPARLPPTLAACQAQPLLPPSRAAGVVERPRTAPSPVVPSPRTWAPVPTAAEPRRAPSPTRRPAPLERGTDEASTSGRVASPPPSTQPVTRLGRTSRECCWCVCHCACMACRIRRRRVVPLQPALSAHREALQHHTPGLAGVRCSCTGGVEQPLCCLSVHGVHLDHTHNLPRRAPPHPPAHACCPSLLTACPHPTRPPCTSCLYFRSCRAAGARRSVVLFAARVCILGRRCLGERMDGQEAGGRRATESPSALACSLLCKASHPLVPQPCALAHRAPLPTHQHPAITRLW